MTKVPQLPKRKDFPRLRPLSYEQWRGHMDHEGKIEDVESVKTLIFRGVSFLGESENVSCARFKMFSFIVPLCENEFENKSQ